MKKPLILLIAFLVLGIPRTVVAQDSKSKLFQYAAQGNLGKVKKLLKKGYDINTVWDGYTPVDVAFVGNHIEVVTLLMENGVPSKMDEGQQMLLRKTIENDWMPMLQALISSESYNKDGEDLVDIAINTAIDYNKPNALSYLLKDQDLNTEDEYYPISFSVAYSGFTELVPVLAKAGMINTVNYSGLTAYDKVMAMDGAEDQYIQAWKNNGALSGVEIAEDPYDKAIIAVKSNNMEWLKSQQRSNLMTRDMPEAEDEEEEDYSKRTERAKPLFFLALEEGNNEMLDFLSPLVKKDEVDPTTGYSAIVTAVKSSNADGLDYCLANGFKVLNYSDSSKCETSLYQIASLYVDDEIFQKVAPLYKKTINVQNCEEKEGGFTVLGYAASNHDVNKVKALLAQGADPNVKCNDSYVLDIDELDISEYDAVEYETSYNAIKRIREMLTAAGAKSEK